MALKFKTRLTARRGKGGKEKRKEGKTKGMKKKSR